MYCGGQGGDQGTRAIVNNLYSGTFTTKDKAGEIALTSELTKPDEKHKDMVTNVKAVLK